MEKCAYLNIEYYPNKNLKGNTYIDNKHYEYRFCKYENSETKFCIENECPLKRNLIETTNDEK